MVDVTWLTDLALFAADNGGGGTAPMLRMLWPFLMIGILFWLLLIRPQRQEQAKRHAKLDALKKNDVVIAAGGIYGVVADVDREGNRVTLKVDEKTDTRLRVTLSSVIPVMQEEPSDGKSSSK